MPADRHSDITPAASFDLASVESGVSGTRFAGHIHHLITVGSTNALALEAAQSGAQSGVWVADEQTAGRGRGGHRWHSSAGDAFHPDGLYLSALVIPRLPLSHAARIPLATALAVSRAIARCCAVTPDIRWPNDLLLNRRKFGGILVETATKPAGSPTTPMLQSAVLGVGLNLNHETFPPEIQHLATSLRRETGIAYRREPILIALLQELEAELNALESVNLKHESEGDLLERFARASTWVRGKRVRVGEEESYTGVTTGLDANGFLLVDGDDGQRHTVLSGGVREA